MNGLFKACLKNVDVRGISYTTPLCSSKHIRKIDWLTKPAVTPVKNDVAGVPHYVRAAMLPIKKLYLLREHREIDERQLDLKEISVECNKPTTKENLKTVFELASRPDKGLSLCSSEFGKIGITGYRVLSGSSGDILKQALLTLPISVSFKLHPEIKAFRGDVIRKVSKTAAPGPCLSGVIVGLATKERDQYFQLQVCNANEVGLKEVIDLMCNVKVFTSAFQPFIEHEHENARA